MYARVLVDYRSVMCLNVDVTDERAIFKRIYTHIECTLKRLEFDFDIFSVAKIQTLVIKANFQHLSCLNHICMHSVAIVTGASCSYYQNECKNKM